MTQTRDLENPVEVAIRELKARSAVTQEFIDYHHRTVIDFLKSKTFKRMWLRFSHDKTTGGTIALHETSYLCAVVWHAALEAAKQEIELSARVAALCS
jgi:hypothetical protein